MARVVRGAFHDLDSAVNAAAQMLQEATQPQASGMTFRSGLITQSGARSAINSSGGSPIPSSSSQREVYSHEYQQTIHPRDREHLAGRHSIGRYIVYQVPRDTFFLPPRTGNASIDSFIAEAWRKRFGHAATAADIRQRKQGGAFIYVVTTGARPDTPLSSTERLVSFATIGPENVNENASRKVAPNQRSHNNHDMQEVVLNSTTIETEKGELKIEAPRIHGSRLIAVNEDEETGRDWRSQAPVLTVAHDALWDFQDIIVAHRNAAIQGRPIVLEVDTEQEYTSRVAPEQEGTDEDPMVQFEEELEEFRGFEREAFSPIEGMVFRRLEAVDLADPSAVLQNTAARISKAAPELPMNKVAPTSEAARQTDADIEEVYFGNILRRQYRFAWHIYNSLVEDIGKALGLVPQSARFPVFQGRIEWPDPKYYNRKVTSFIDSRDAQTARTARQAGHEPSDRVEDKMPRSGEPVDHETVLPSRSITQKAAPPEGAEPPEDQAEPPEGATAGGEPLEPDPGRDVMDVDAQSITGLRDMVQEIVGDKEFEEEMME